MGVNAAAGVSAAPPNTSAVQTLRRMDRVTWQIEGTLFDKPCVHILDTGAEFTIAQLGIMSAPVRESHIQMRQAERSADGAPLYGPRDVTLGLDGYTMTVPMFEANIHEQCLLGLDFVTAHVASVDVERDQLILTQQHGGRRVQMTRITRPVEVTPASLWVQCAQRTVIPANSEVCVTVTVSNCDLWDSNEYRASRAGDLANHLSRDGVVCCHSVGGEERVPGCVPVAGCVPAPWEASWVPGCVPEAGCVPAPLEASWVPGCVPEAGCVLAPLETGRVPGCVPVAGCVPAPLFPHSSPGSASARPFNFGWSGRTQTNRVLDTIMRIWRDPRRLKDHCTWYCNCWRIQI